VAVGTGGRKEVARKGIGGCIPCKYCRHLNINAKMICIETIPGIGEGEVKE
jgi:hypothetical protein